MWTDYLLMYLLDTIMKVPIISFIGIMLTAIIWLTDAFENGNSYEDEREKYLARKTKYKWAITIFVLLIIFTPTASIKYMITKTNMIEQCINK